MKTLVMLLLTGGMLNTVAFAADPSAGTLPESPFARFVAEWQQTFHDYGGDISLWTDMGPTEGPPLFKTSSTIDPAARGTEWEQTFRDHGGDVSLWTTAPESALIVVDARSAQSPEDCRAEWEETFRDYGGDISLWTDRCDCD